MKIEEHIEYWLNSADHDLDTAESLFAAEKYFKKIKEQYKWIKSLLKPEK